MIAVLTIFLVLLTQSAISGTVTTFYCEFRDSIRPNFYNVHSFSLQLFAEGDEEVVDKFLHHTFVSDISPGVYNQRYTDKVEKDLSFETWAVSRSLQGILVENDDYSIFLNSRTYKGTVTTKETGLRILSCSDRP